MRGFVLVELLIALAILSVVFFYLTPVSVNLFKTTNNKNVDKLDSIINSAYNKAKETGMPQMIWGLKGSNNIHFNNKLFYLSGDVFDVKVNDSYQQGDKYHFFIYPLGAMDNIVMIFSNNKKIVSFPLLLRVQLE